MNLLVELVGLGIDKLGDRALLLILSTICFARIKGDCFSGNAPKEVEFL